MNCSPTTTWIEQLDHHHHRRRNRPHQTPLSGDRRPEDDHQNLHRPRHLPPGTALVRNGAVGLPSTVGQHRPPFGHRNRVAGHRGSHHRTVGTPHRARGGGLQPPRPPCRQPRNDTQRCPVGGLGKRHRPARLRPPGTRQRCPGPRHSRHTDVVVRRPPRLHQPQVGP